MTLVGRFASRQAQIQNAPRSLTSRYKGTNLIGGAEKTVTKISQLCIVHIDYQIVVFLQPTIRGGRIADYYKNSRLFIEIEPTFLQKKSALCVKARNNTCFLVLRLVLVCSVHRFHDNRIQQIYRNPCTILRNVCNHHL